MPWRANSKPEVLLSIDIDALTGNNPIPLYHFSSAHQIISILIHPHIKSSAHQFISTSIHKYINSSAH
jgi:hypothetical protein